MDQQLKMKKKTISFNRPTISKKDLVHVLESMLADRLEEGEMTIRFERALAKYIGSRYCMIVNAPSSALYLILKSRCLSSGEEVIVSAYVDPFVIETVLALGLKPILVDLEEGTYLMSTPAILDKIGPRTKAIIVSHALGYPFNIDALLKKIKADDLTIIEDCTHALGTTVENIHPGQMGDFAFFSFSPDRIITSGEGGAIVSKTKKDHLEIKDLRAYKGQKELKGRLYFSTTDLLSALGLSEISLIDKFLARRREIGNFYLSFILKSRNQFLFPEEKVELNYNYFPIRIHSSLKIARELLKQHGVEAMRPLEELPHRLLGLPDDDFPNAVDIYLKTLALPLYPILKKKEIEMIGKLIAHIE